MPILHAAEKRLAYDAFVVLTDSETMYTDAPPSLALRIYRELSGVADAKLFVCAFAKSNISIADPLDKFMFDFPGLDSALVAVMSDVLTGAFYEAGEEEAMEGEEKD